MKKFCRLNAIALALFLVLGTVVTLNAVTYEHLPSWPDRRGFYYILDMADYPNLFSPGMPPEVMLGYAVADSVLRDSLAAYLPENLLKMNLLLDSAQYIYKYWYLMNEYDPLRFFAFLNRKKDPGVKNNFSGRRLHSSMRHRMHQHPKSIYTTPEYILHIYVNNTDWIDTSDLAHPNISSETVAYCKVLDRIKGGKGGIFPSLNDAIFYNGDSSNIGNPYIVPPQTDLVFSYWDNWERDNYGRRLIDRHGNRWIKPNKEYIVFLEFFAIDAIGSWDPIGSVHKIYYKLSPYPHPGSSSMYPVENGIVKDEQNALGFGTEVPVNIFKQNIRNKIEEIKNYAE